MRREALLLLLLHLSQMSLAALAQVALSPRPEPWDFSRSRRRIVTLLPALLARRELAGALRRTRCRRRVWSYRASVSVNRRGQEIYVNTSVCFWETQVMGRWEQLPRDVAVCGLRVGFPRVACAWHAGQQLFNPCTYVCTC